MSIFSTLNLKIYGDTYEEIVMLCQERICEFYEIEESEIKTKISYEINVEENQEMESGFSYEALVTVRGKDV
jgi:hypothetical protein